ncbi:MAG TPA: lytic transglycosylase domain-containing protein [Thermoanaerobaculia bacterium]|nr:lytic transglycosylase domain-containing protein [Thermoanaerobaculia bacterium]
MQAASQLLDELADADPANASSARLVAGLYAHAAGRESEAEERLAGAATPGGLLEDWRLYALAESALAQGHSDLAERSLVRLADTCPASPLRPRALAAAAELARRRERREQPPVHRKSSRTSTRRAGGRRYHFHLVGGGLDWDRLLAGGDAPPRTLSLFDRDAPPADVLPGNGWRMAEAGEATAARDLWERGWNAYRAADDGAAVGYWSELQSLYPGRSDAHRGLYWQARALERLGQTDQAHDAYRRLVALSDTEDFYGRQALLRLGASASVAWARTRAPQPWRIDPQVRRAKLLTDLGLDDLAARELAFVANTQSAAISAGTPAASGTRERDLLAVKALIVGRRGRRAESIILLREAFPALGTAYQASVPQEILYAYYPLDFGDAIQSAAAAAHLPAALVAGIIRQESAFDPRATSRVGARGLMQLMPVAARETARDLGLALRPASLYDPALSVRLGAAYFKQVLDSFGGDVELALAGYNSGPNRIRRLWAAAGPAARVDDFVENLGIAETRDYVKRILVLADSYRQLYPGLALAPPPPPFVSRPAGA